MKEIFRFETYEIFDITNSKDENMSTFIFHFCKKNKT